MNTKTETTNIITQDHPVAPYVIILDENDNEIGLVKSYNVDTKEAEVYRASNRTTSIVNNVHVMGGIDLDENNKPIIDKVILHGSKLRFRDVKNTKVEIKEE